MRARIEVADLERARRWYADVLGTRDPRIELVAGACERPADDDLVEGVRHVGFKVHDVDATAERLAGHGVEFTIGPLTAVGDVRLAFFHDPDGTLLEIVSGALQYHETPSPELAAEEAASLPAAGDPARFDHVAVTVGDVDAAVAEVGLPVIGRLYHRDERGFTITYLQAGDAVLELFSFDVPTRPGDDVGVAYELG